MRRDFLTLVRRPAELLKSLRRITVGGLIAATAAAPTTAAANQTSGTARTAALRPTIVDRSKKAAKLVLQLPGITGFLRAEHRSHRSHSSHRSHYSGGGGGAVPAPRPVRPRTAPETTSPSSVLDLSSASAANLVSGEIVAIDRSARTITLRQSIDTRITFAYRDDSKFESAIGVGLRFDEFADENRGLLPVATRDKVEVKWRTTTDGKARIITSLKKVP